MKKVVIVGGGSAGWMSAAFLSKVLGGSISVTLLDAQQIPSVGVGEATIPSLKLFNNWLGITEPEFMASTNATFKLGIQFESWGEKNDQYMHAFGPSGTPIGLTPFWHYWLRGKSLGDKSTLGEYSFNAVAAQKNRFGHSKTPVSPGNPNLTYAYHFDAEAYAKLLQTVSEKQGVTHREGTLFGVKLDPQQGHITQLTLTDGSTLSGDFFIDCTGQKSLLLGDALGVSFESWAHWLPCDRAVTVQSDAQLAAPYTRAIAHDFGWQWQIPLQNRTGNGLVYASQYCSDATALEALSASLPGNAITDAKTLYFKVGRHQSQWYKNCMAVGLSSGFLEPLESTGLHMIQSSLVRFAKLFSGFAMIQAGTAEFNRQAKIEAEGIRDFIILHYSQNRRNSGDFWKAIRANSVPTSLEEKIQLFSDTGYLYRRDDELFDENAWSQVLIGHGVIPRKISFLAENMEAEKVSKFLVSLRGQVNHFCDRLESHEGYLSQYCMNKSATCYV